MGRAFNHKSTSNDVLDGIDLKGKHIFITGVSSGLGLETSRALVAHGAHVTGAVRDIERAEQAIKPIRALAKKSGGELELVQMDLSDLSSVRATAALTLASGHPIDVLIANAGILAPPYSLTVDGYEQQFATNFLGHFVLAKRLAIGMLRGARLIVLTSNAHRMADINLNDVNFERRAYDPWVAYSASKTACSLLAVGFDEKYKDKGIRAAAVHPGVIQTELTRNLSQDEFAAALQAMNDQHIALGNTPFTPKSIEQGAATTLWASFVANPDAIGGRYCEDCGVGKELSNGNVSAFEGGFLNHAVNKDRAEQLWQKVLELTGE